MGQESKQVNVRVPMDLFESMMKIVTKTPGVDNLSDATRLLYYQVEAADVRGHSVLQEGFSSNDNDQVIKTITAMSKDITVIKNVNATAFEALGVHQSYLKKGEENADNELKRLQTIKSSRQYVVE